MHQQLPRDFDRDFSLVLCGAVLVIRRTMKLSADVVLVYVIYVAVQLIGRMNARML